MDMWTIVGLLITGGIGKAIVDQIFRGWNQRRIARGNNESKTDALYRSRLWLLERLYSTRRLVIEAGKTPPPFDETEDPYMVWEKRAQPSLDKE